MSKTVYTLPARKAFVPSPKKSSGQKFMSDIVFIIALSSVIFLIQCIFKAMFYPVRYLFKSRTDIENEEIERARKRVEARIALHEEWEEDPSDPLNIASGNTDASASEVKECKAWYKRWKEGLVPDPELRWAPEVYTNQKVNPDFLAYMDIQLALIRRQSAGTKWKFIQTLRKYYPEFKPTFGGARKDLEILMERSRCYQLSNDLVSRIEAFGISKSMAKSLAKQDLSAEELKKKIKTAKECMERGLCETMIELIVKRGIPFNARFEEKINPLLKNGMPVEFVEAVIDDEITTEQMVDISIEWAQIRDLWGTGNFFIDEDENGRSRAEIAVEDLLNRARREKLPKPVWEK